MISLVNCAVNNVSILNIRQPFQAPNTQYLPKQANVIAAPLMPHGLSYQGQGNMQVSSLPPMTFQGQNFAHE